MGLVLCQAAVCELGNDFDAVKEKKGKSDIFKSDGFGK